MEEAVIEDKKKGEEKRKSMYTIGESSGLTKRGTGRSFSAGSGNFSCGSDRGIGQVIAGGQLLLRIVLSMGGDIWDNVGDQLVGLRAKAVLGVVAEELKVAEALVTEMRGSSSFNDVISGTILLFDVEAYVLIDPGSTHSFISSELASKIPGKNSPLGYNLMVYLPVGGGVVVNSVRKGSIVRIGDVNLPVDLVVMDLEEFDVILGMDWLAKHRAVVDYYKKEVMIKSSGKPKVVFVGDRHVVPVCVISAIEARRLMLEGCDTYLAHVIDAEKVSPTLEEIPVVRDFPEVFPDDLPGLPPHREVDFTIETLPGVSPISIAPYRMAPVELQELKQ
ncbi:UNVERIFIED_CONTAM: hypothetical protein Sangu_2504300 [Sesamum angustifolium]|uniref:Uncharacterized protein n=1 Tax=Sesamum angustifolium TaxID=2727405 RepID=A0AAW2K1X8_9LAMI